MAVSTNWGGVLENGFGTPFKGFQGPLLDRVDPRHKITSS